eukprot:gene10569-11690_t
MAGRLIWTDQATSTLLEALRSRESLWNSKSERYKNRNVKKKEYAEIKDMLKDEIPLLDLPALKGKIQSLRTTFREEMRKVKKSQGTGSGSADVYLPKWRFFEECMFLEEVIISTRPSMSNVVANDDASNDILDEIEASDDEESLQSLEVISTPQNETAHPRRKRKIPWMEKAASALSDLAKGATNETPNNEKKEDEWDVFGRDVANTIRGLGNTDWQRRVKFAIQTAIFQTVEEQRSLSQQQAANYNYFNRQENSGGPSGGSRFYHDLMPPNNK